MIVWSNPVDVAERKMGYISVAQPYKDIKTVSKSVVFRSVLDDIIYSLGVSLKKTTDSNNEVRLSKIRMKPMKRDGVIVIGRIKNLIGGKVSCLLDNSLLGFLNDNIKYDVEGLSPLHVFIMDFFDNFSSMSRTDLFQLHPCKFDCVEQFLPDSLYYISFDIKIYSGGKMISSKFIVSLDEITALYF